MANKNEPCSICEDYIEGVVCDKDLCPVAIMKAEIERLQNALCCEELKVVIGGVNHAKSEAIKEFAERLKKEVAHIPAWGSVAEKKIDNLVKEMTEVKE